MNPDCIVFDDELTDLERWAMAFDCPALIDQPPPPPRTDALKYALAARVERLTLAGDARASDPQWRDAAAWLLATARTEDGQSVWLALRRPAGQRT